MSEEKTLAEAMYPGFEIRHVKCGGTNVSVDNTLGFSATSGGWGDVSLHCEDCDESVEIVSPS